MSLPSPPALSQFRRGELESGSLLPVWEKGLGEGFAPLREEGEDLDTNKSAFLNDRACLKSVLRVTTVSKELNNVEDY